MPAVCRLNDISTGHADWPPRRNDSAATDVYVNNKGVHRVGDHWPTHCNSIPECHDGTLAQGSFSVYANGNQIGRIGDPISCGDHVAEGSDNVFSG